MKTTRFLRNKEPFFFMVNFEGTKLHVYSFDEASENRLKFDINGVRNYQVLDSANCGTIEPIEAEPYPFKDYLKSFEEVVSNLKNGNSFLVNLTFPSRIKNKVDLAKIFHCSKAGYKLLNEDKFVCFSPECFVKIENDFIYSYPMKGTIDANLENAESILLNDPKEEQEHNTIVDLIRNDLSLVSKEVTVTKFRYVEKIKSARGNILQTSSEIRGKLSADWKNNFGELLLKMLPAGSISGAPKPKTVDIIKKSENYDRGYYTGVFGVFDGNSIDSAVAIRFIEKNDGVFWYKSGGGITHQSNVKEEYIELLKKIYVPTI
ncbi:aminodeoxychorismate synthase component I [Croceivirga thetidis]|nr:aminodeoxychorismate synthase component I [Croceivirga thetidis]